MEQQVGPVNQPQSPSLSSPLIIFKHFRIHPDGELKHYRRGKNRETNLPWTPWCPQERGGETVCFIYDEAGHLVTAGQAWCSPKDQFCYRIGRLISEGRARKAARVINALRVVPLDEGQADES